MNTFKFLIITLATISINTQAVTDEGQEIIDNRKRTDYTRLVQGDMIIENNHIDLSAPAVTAVFQSLNEEYLKVKPAPVSRNYVYMTSAEMNNQMLVTYKITSERRFVVILKTSNDNAEKKEDRVHKQRLVFKCKMLNVVKEFMCMPANCDLSNFEPIDTPGTDCDDHYNESQDLIEYTFETVKEISPTEDFIKCVKERMEIVTPNPKTMCFYVGFRPNNIVPLSTYEEKFLENGYVKVGDSYEKKSLIQTRVAQVKIDELTDIFA